MLLRDCEGLYKCGKGTEELCSKALCPFYKPQPKEPKLIETKRIATIQAKPKVEEGEWVLDDFSGLWTYRRTN